MKNCTHEILRELMDERGISYERLSLGTGIPKSTLFEWVKNKRAPSLDGNILKVSRFFEVSLEYLGFGTDEPEVSLPSASRKCSSLKSLKQLDMFGSNENEEMDHQLNRVN